MRHHSPGPHSYLLFARLLPYLCRRAVPPQSNPCARCESSRRKETGHLNKLAQDLRYAFRQLRRAPGFAFTAIFTLALGIGASSAIFCLIDNLWLHPLRVPHPGELVRVFATTKQSPTADEGVDTYFNWPEYQTIAARAMALKTAVALGRRGSLMVRSDGTSVLLLTNVVSGNF